MNIKLFRINISQLQLDDLHESIKKTIWPTLISEQNYGGPQIDNRQELARKALSLPFQDLFLTYFANIVVNATDPGIHTADA